MPVFFVIPERQRQRLGAGFARLRSNAGVRTALTDLVPTALDLLGLSGDAKVKRWLEQLDGRSLLRPVADDRLVVVVNTDDATLIVPRDKVEDVKDLVAFLKKDGQSNLI